MREKTGRRWRVVAFAVVSAWSGALLVGCDSDKADPVDPTPSVVTEETSRAPDQDTDEDTDPDEDRDVRPTGDGESEIPPPPPPPTATDGGGETPKSNPSLTPDAPPPPDKSPEPAGT